MKIVRPNRATPRKQRLLAIDVENDPKSGDFICAHLYSEAPKVDKYFVDLGVLHSFLMAQHTKGRHRKTPFILVAFNWGYDAAFLSPILNDAKTCWAGSRFICSQLKNGIKLLDLCNHVDGSLEDWIEHLKMTDKYGLKKETLEDLEVRVKSDTKATYYLGEFLNNFYADELSVPFHYTVGGGAYSLFTSQFFQHFWKRTDEQQWINDYERKAFRGGRTECFERGRIKHLSYDVNSMYLSIMFDAKIPDPMTARYVLGSTKFVDNFAKYDTIVNCRVFAPEAKVMVLPYPDPKTGKLLFPHGRFDGYWTGVELKKALEYGYKIEKVYSYIYYRKSHQYFREFAKYVWAMRKEYKDQGNKGMDLMIKKIGNTCFGKIGQQNAKSGFWGKQEDYQGTFEGLAPVFKTIDGVDYVCLSGGDKADGQHTFPVVPVFITSLARVKLLDALKSNEEGLIYCDTDSIKSRYPIKGLEIGDDLGQWGFEGIKECIFHKPKMYGDKIKGVPKRGIKIGEDATHQYFIFEKPRRYKESLRSGKTVNQWYEQLKVVDKADDKRVWQGKKSKPIEIVYTEVGGIENE